MNRKSMTGFGRGEATNAGRTWTVELRSVNNRYFDLKMKLPSGYRALEERIRRKAALYHQRGRVELSLVVSGDFSDLLTVQVNRDLASAYIAAMDDLAVMMGVENNSDPATLAKWPDVLVRRQESEAPEEVWAVVEQALDQALTECIQMRAQEGEAMARDLKGRLEQFGATVGRIEEAVPELLIQRKNVLQEKLEALLDNTRLDPQRLAQEVAILADKTDVTEEIVRLHSHINQFQTFLKEPDAVGRKIDFLLQEFLREVNTLGSKINDASIAHLIVDLKSELEKMREQIQNIE